MQITPAPTPAASFVERHQFLVRPDSEGIAAAVELRAVGADTVEVVVADPWTEPSEWAEEADEFYADTAASVLEPVVDGVKLIVRTSSGYVGREGWFSGDEQYFANSLPGVTRQAAEVGWDMDGDGAIADDETAFLFPVASREDIARLDPIVRDRMGHYPVVFEVDAAQRTAR